MLEEKRLFQRQTSNTCLFLAERKSRKEILRQNKNTIYAYAEAISQLIVTVK